ncbi:MAG: SLC13 family permease [Gammaproteobacteria bacterium]
MGADFGDKEAIAVDQGTRPGWFKQFALAAGPLLGLTCYLWLGAETAMAHGGRATAAMAVWMALWWMTEAIPIFATAMLPLALFPLLGIADGRATAAPYANPLIFLFLGGFVIAIATEKWGLHRRIALRALRMVGNRADQVVGAFMLVSAFLSMWISNTATAILMLPIALSIIHRSDTEQGHHAAVIKPADRQFSLALLLGIAYSASVGGIGTLIGTPPNLFLASFARDQLGVHIGFAQWMAVALPLVLVLLCLIWLLLTRVLFKCVGYRLAGDAGLAEMPSSMNTGERWTLLVFLSAAGLWITRPLLNHMEFSGYRPLANLNDTGIAMLAAVVLFLLPAGDGRRVMDWDSMKRVPWGLLLLFGGGLTLAAAMQEQGVSDFLGQQLSDYHHLSPVLLVILATSLMVFLTELTSNTATTAAMVPIFAAVSEGVGLPPMLLATAAAVSASCAFMLPVATPPNAIVFGSGHVGIRDMMRAGIWLNLICIALVSAWVLLVLKHFLPD